MYNINLCKYGKEKVEKKDIVIVVNDINIDTMNSTSENPIDFNILLQGFILHINTINKDAIRFTNIGFVFIFDNALFMRENIYTDIFVIKSFVISCL
jgi:hypothetical protein